MDDRVGCTHWFKMRVRSEQGVHCALCGVDLPDEQPKPEAEKWTKE